ncbi:Hypothetical protein ACI5QL_00532 [Bacillus velezensis]|uniref:Uncharacterized protein n=1 Tax=Bacillus amyloliquefaciens (strain Y2) TaxID=1155777 RepID=I2C1N8_BACAY|nr:hypothetical protein MUS_0488 [Bacillus velezensis YAU B9601-Y2]
MISQKIFYQIGDKKNGFFMNKKRADIKSAPFDERFRLR